MVEAKVDLRAAQSERDSRRYGVRNSSKIGNWLRFSAVLCPSQWVCLRSPPGPYRNRIFPIVGY